MRTDCVLRLTYHSRMAPPRPPSCAAIWPDGPDFPSGPSTFRRLPLGRFFTAARRDRKQTSVTTIRVVTVE